MRIVGVGLLCGALMLGSVTAASAAGPPSAGNALGAAASNIVYFPAKLVMALGGLFTGGLVGVMTGGDIEAAYAIWVPTASGDFLVTPRKLEGREPLRVLGDDYADSPSQYLREDSGTAVYDSTYQSAGRSSSNRSYDMR